MIVFLGEELIDAVVKMWPPFSGVEFPPYYKSFNTNSWDVDWREAYIKWTPAFEDFIIQVTSSVLSVTEITSICETGKQLKQWFSTRGRRSNG